MDGVTDPRWKTITLPGADWQVVMSHVLRNKRRLKNSYIYIHVGPVRFTSLVRAQSRRECLFQRAEFSSVNNIFCRWDELVGRYNIIPIICPLYPMDFNVYNGSLRARLGRDGVLANTADYDSWNRRIRSEVEIENQGIIEFNERTGMCTPFLHRSIFRRRKGRFCFRPHLLRDGLHPTPATKVEWRRELSRVHRLNRGKWRLGGGRVID